MEILYRDAHLVAVNKPAGLLVHRSSIDPHETRFALQLVRDQIGQRVYPIHRLDKPTSGALLFALSSDDAASMAAIFARREVRKEYLAVVRGYIAPTGTVDYALTEPRDKKADARIDPTKGAQSAITDYRRLATAELAYPVGRYPSARYSLVNLMPHTGRRRQIRRHMKHIFHPIIGDTSHGDGKHNQFFRDRLNIRRLLLAATRLEFRHPHSGAWVELNARLDSDFDRALEALGWSSTLAQSR